MINTGKLAGQTLFITGASRGIGKAIALKAAKDGANIVIAAKTTTPHPKLPGTIFTAAEEIEKAGGKSLPCAVDIRDETQVKKAVEEAVKKFGGIDIVVNNASAINLAGTADTDMKRFDLMHNINTRGTFLVSKECLPYLKKSKNPHILNLSPPLNMNPIWFKNHLAYTLAKYGMSMCVLGMHEEFKAFGIAVNALWARTAINTSFSLAFGQTDLSSQCRKPDIYADAAYAILIKDSKAITGNFFIDDEVIKTEGISDLTQYACDLNNADNLMPDFFLDTNYNAPALASILQSKKTSNIEPPVGEIGKLFKSIESGLSPDSVTKTQAIFAFVVTGDEAGRWYIDLKTGNGACGQGEPPSPPDATVTMDSKNFLNLFAGKLKPATAYMMGKLKIKGNLQQAMKLEKLMTSLKDK